MHAYIYSKYEMHTHKHRSWGLQEFLQLMLQKNFETNNNEHLMLYIWGYIKCLDMLTIQYMSAS